MYEPPYFKEKLFDVEVVDGDSALLMCHVKGTPEPDIYWYKDGKVCFVIHNYYAKVETAINLKLNYA